MTSEVVAMMVNVYLDIEKKYLNKRGRDVRFNILTNLIFYIGLHFTLTAFKIFGVLVFIILCQLSHPPSPPPPPPQMHSLLALFLLLLFLLSARPTT